MGRPIIQIPPRLDDFVVIHRIFVRLINALTTVRDTVTSNTNAIEELQNASNADTFINTVTGKSLIVKARYENTDIALIRSVEIIDMDTTTGNRNIQLPSHGHSKAYVIRKYNTSAGSIQINAAAGDTIDGAAFVTISGANNPTIVIFAAHDEWGTR